VSGAQLIIACLLLPTAGGGAIAMAGRRAALQAWVALGAAALLLAGVLCLLAIVWSGGVPQLFVLEMLPGIALGFRVEPLGMVFALSCAAIWVAALARPYLRPAGAGGAAPRARLALSIAAAIGVAFAANLATLALFCAILTPLTRARIVPAAAAAVLLLAALAGTWALAGTLEFLPGGVLGAKASGAPSLAVVALHLAAFGVWSLAPARHGLRVGAGVFAALKLLVYVYGVTL
jgi:multicomponent Na+:H+ antiporter subunit D